MEKYIILSAIILNNIFDYIATVDRSYDVCLVEGINIYDVNDKGRALILIQFSN